MSDEEKDAKLELNRYIYGKNLSKDEITDYLSIIFGLIKKQSKEIEQLKDIEQKICNEELLEQEYVKENFIAKDKIKAKIEEYKQNVKEFEEYWGKDPRKFKKTESIDYYKLEALQELLEKE